MFSVLKNSKITICALKAADNETLTGTILDMQGYDTVAFIAGALEGEAGAPSVKAQEDSDPGGGTMADLAGSATAFATTAAAKGLATLEIHQPNKRYVRSMVTVPDWTAKPVFCLALQFNARDLPVSNAGALLVSPAEGTA